MGNTLFKHLISYTFIASIFITGPSLGGQSFSLYWFYPFYICFVIYSVLVYKRINIAIAGVAFFIVIYSLVSFKSDFSLVIKQLTNILSVLLASYFFFVHEDYSFDKIFRKYILVA